MQEFTSAEPPLSLESFSLFSFLKHSWNEGSLFSHTWHYVTLFTLLRSIIDTLSLCDLIIMRYLATTTNSSARNFSHCTNVECCAEILKISSIPSSGKKHSSVFIQLPSFPQDKMSVPSEALILSAIDHVLLLPEFR